MRKKFFPIIFKNSRYADRLPIGKVEVIENFKHDVLRDFYSDWYRPELQAVIVVGDIDPDMAEAKIKAHFSAIKNPESPKERISYDIPDNKEPLIAITTDKEATNNVVFILYKHPLTVEKTLGDFRENILAELYTGMMNSRLNEISQKPESPYAYAGANYGRFLARTKDAYFIQAMAKENQIDKSLEILLAENERVKRFGFTQTELDRQKEDMLSQYEKASKEFDKTESMQFTNEYVSHFLSGDPIPGAQKKFKYVTKLLPGIQLEEINALAKKWVTDDNMAMVVMAPEKEGVKVPNEAQILDIINQSKTNDLKPYVDNYREEPLVQGDIAKGKISETTKNGELAYVEFKLSNGITVVLKSTSFKNDEILVSAYSPGGTSLVPDKEFMSANFASQVIDMSGAGNFDNIELQKKLKGKNLQISPYIDDIKEGFRGRSTPKDLETMMQLVYLYFKGPRKDTTAFQAFMSQMENQMKFMKNSPIMTFYDTLYKTVYPGYKRMIIFPSPAQLNEVDLDQIYRIYKDRFADASDFTFFIVGNFDFDTISPLIEKYFGSLPNLDRNETWKNISPKFAEGKTNLKVYKGTDPQSMVGIVMSENFTWDEKTILHFKMINEILSIKLVEVIREELSGVYSPRIIINWDHFPISNYQLIVMFGCSPKTTDKLTKAVFAEIKKIIKKGPTDVDLKKAQEALLRSRETDLEKNDFWLNKLESIYFNRDSPESVTAYKDRVNSVTLNDLQRTAQTWFHPDHYVRVILMPESGK
jgi:zinc protease